MPTGYGHLHSDGFRKPKRNCLTNRLNLLVAAVLGVGVVLTLLNIYQLQQMREEHQQHLKNKQDAPITIVEAVAEKGTRNAPVVWINGKKKNDYYLDHVKAAFSRLGFIIIQDEGEDWDVLWVHEYPFFTMSTLMHNLQPHQRVNHFPGSGYITNKASLATLKLDAFPKCFRIPVDKDKFYVYAKEHPEKMWVQKNSNHRGIRIKQISELNFEEEGSILQEFVSKPLLIDSRKFDIGVYTILTSLDPLRVYIINDEALFRFCSKDYYPFDASDIEKYVVTDDYTPMWQMPSFKDLYVDKKFSFKESFNRYIDQSGLNSTKIWNDIHNTIRAVYLKKQSMLMSAGVKYKSIKNFFEMVRFDFVLDEDLKLYLMEVNMSPNLSTGHFRGNKRLYEHVMYNTLRVSRVASMVENHFHNSDKDVMDMLVSDREITVFSDWCTSAQCKDECLDSKCDLCSHCMTPTMKSTIKDAYLEHVNKAGCMRVFPPVLNYTTALKWSPHNDPFNLMSYPIKNRKMFMWFIGMCRKDQSFCT